MGQQEVMEFLERSNEKLTSGQIAERMNEQPSKINHILFLLCKWGDIQYMEVDRHEAQKLCGTKRRCKVYYIRC